MAIAVIARVATRTLTPQARVTFFRSLGRSYLCVGGPALLIALATGALLLTRRPWDELSTTVVALVGALTATTIAGVLQARSMTRLRQHALGQSSDELQARVRRSARHASLLRALIGALSLALLILGVLLTT